MAPRIYISITQQATTLLVVLKFHYNIGNIKNIFSTEHAQKQQNENESGDKNGKDCDV
jgi:hypothetical protein